MRFRVCGLKQKPVILILGQLEFNTKWFYESSGRKTLHAIIKKDNKIERKKEKNKKQKKPQKNKKQKQNHTHIWNTVREVL